MTQKFVLMVGDDAAVLVLVEGTTVKQRLFAKSAAISDRRDISALFAKYPKVPVYVIIDTMEQTFTEQTLPAVSSLAVGGLVQKRLDRDFAKSDIKGAILLGRDKDGRKDWIYLFASTPMTTNISDWIDYVTSLGNKFVGIYMMPVEMQAFAVNYKKSKSKKSKKDNENTQEIKKETTSEDGEKKKIANRWQFFVTHNKTGGFRQTVLKNDKVIFTRLIKAGKDTLPDIIAGNIEQEIINTIDYLRRLSFEEQDELEIVAILGADLKASMKGTNVRDGSLSIYTPLELAQKFGYKSAVMPDDKFADILLAVSFLNSKNIMHLDTQKIRKVNSLLAVGLVLKIIVMIGCPSLLLMSGKTAYDIIVVNQEIDKIENEKGQIDRQWREANKSLEYNIDDAQKISNAVQLYKALTAKFISPYDIIAKLAGLQKNQALTKSFSWSYIQKASSTDGSTSEDMVLNVLINMDFYNRGRGVEDLLRNYDSFTKSMINGFTDYAVEVSKLPEKLDLNDQRSDIPVQIKIDQKDGNSGAEQ